MVDIARLGLAVDSSQVDKGAMSLRKLTGEARKADTANDGLAVSSKGAASAQKVQTAATTAQTAALHANAGAARLAAFQQRNLSFQLMDVGQSLALGMNPMMVFMQQGSQIAQIYGPSEGGVGRALAESAKMAGRFALRLGPIAAIAGAVGVGVAAMTNEINKTAKTQVSVVDVLQASWELLWERVVSAGQPVMDWLASVWDSITPHVAGAAEYIIDVFDIAFKDIGAVWKTLPNILGETVMNTANGVIAGIEWMINQAISAINGMLLSMKSNPLVMHLLDNPLWQTGFIDPVQLGRMDNQFAGASSNLQQQFAQNRADAFGTSAIGAIGERAQVIANRPDEEELEKAAKEAARARDAYQKLTGSVHDRIAAARLEVDVLGMTATEARALRIEQDLLNSAANDNIDLTAAQQKELTGLAGALAQAEVMAERMREAYEFGKETFSSFFSDFAHGIRDGMSAIQSFGSAAISVLNKIADKALTVAANGIWDLIWGGISGPLAASPGGGFGSPVNSFTGLPPMYASGGWTGGTAGRAAGIVHGEEFVVRAGPAARYRPMLEAMNSNSPMPANSNTNGHIEVTVVTKMQKDGSLIPLMAEVAGEVAGKRINQTVPAMIRKGSGPAVVAARRNREVR